MNHITHSDTPYCDWFDWCMLLEESIATYSLDDLRQIRGGTIALALRAGESTWAPYAAARFDRGIAEKSV